MKRTLSIIMILVLIMTAVAALPFSGASAAGWPSVSASRRIEFIASATFAVYSNKACTIRGTSNPYANYNSARVDKYDKCWVLEISGSSCRISYPAGSVYKEAWTNIGNIFPSGPAENKVCSKKVTTYQLPGGNSYGYVDPQDLCTPAGERSGYQAVIYPLNSGGYKLGWIPSAQYKSAFSVQKPVTKHLRGVPNFKQYDSRWGSVYINTKTIAQVGCLVTSMAMSESYRQGKTITPDVMKRNLSFVGNDMVWPSRYSTLATGTGAGALSAVFNAINAGKPVIVGGSSGRGSHWVLIYGYTNAVVGSLKAVNFEINDPNSTSRTTLQAFLNTYGSGVIFKTY